MIVISDTTPIITLIKINRIDLLEKLFGEVSIPEAVFHELTTNNAFANEAEIVKLPRTNSDKEQNGTTENAQKPLILPP